MGVDSPLPSLAFRQLHRQDFARCNYAFCWGWHFCICLQGVIRDRNLLPYPPPGKNQPTVLYFLRRSHPNPKGVRSLIIISVTRPLFSHSSTPLELPEYLSKNIKRTLETWLLRSPSNRHVPYHAIPQILLELPAEEQAIRTAMQELGYTRRIAPRKGFSTERRVIAKRLAFAQRSNTME
jgi:hypothetical protein